MRIVATICSRHKREDTELLSAWLRYAGSHIAKVREISDNSHMSFYILSGKYGLISAHTEIPYYDYYLENEKMGTVTEKMRKMGTVTINS